MRWCGKRFCINWNDSTILCLNLSSLELWCHHNFLQSSRKILLFSMEILYDLIRIILNQERSTIHSFYLICLCIVNLFIKLILAKLTCFLISVPPDIDEKLTSADQTVLEGSNATLKCVAQGLPHPEVGNFGIVYGYIFGRVQFRFIDSMIS